MLPRIDTSGSAASRATMLAILLIAVAVFLQPTIHSASIAARHTPANAPGGQTTKPETLETVQGPNYVVIPMQGVTELQKLLLPATQADLDNAKAFVLVNGAAVAVDRKTLDGSALDLTQLRSALQPFTDREKGIVFFQVFHRHTGSSPELLLWALQGFGPWAGFHKARVRNEYNPLFVWKETVTDVLDAAKRQSDIHEETGIGNGLVKVYPVRTAVSHVLTSDSDCFADVLPAFGKVYDDDLNPEVRQALSEFISKLELKSKEKLMLNVRITNQAERDAADMFVNTKKHMRLGQALGFDVVSVHFDYQ